MVPIIPIFDTFINQISRGWINIIITVYFIHEIITSCPCKSEHMLINRIEGDEGCNIVRRTYVINGDRKHSGDEDMCY